MARVLVTRGRKIHNEAGEVSRSGGFHLTCRGSPLSRPLLWGRAPAGIPGVMVIKATWESNQCLVYKG